MTVLNNMKWFEKMTFVVHLNNVSMKYLFLILIAFIFLLSSCKKRENIDFTLDSLTLVSFDKHDYPEQKVFLKVLQLGTNPDKVLAITDNYSTEYTLPAKFGIEPQLTMNFYKNDYVVELWGELSGFIGRNEIHLEDYKIIYPTEMETEHNNVVIELTGTWK